MKLHILAIAVAMAGLTSVAHAEEADQGRFAVTAGFAAQHLGGDKPLNVQLIDVPVG